MKMKTAMRSSALSEGWDLAPFRGSSNNPPLSANQNEDAPTGAFFIYSSTSRACSSEEMMKMKTAMQSSTLSGGWNLPFGIKENKCKMED
ncbi:MAG: hypothetical protein HQ500_12895 [Flavobacteriales bacterium]|nr:hypothetical protein [Flavobacteriales bacterium]